MKIIVPITVFVCSSVLLGLSLYFVATCDWATWLCWLLGILLVLIWAIVNIIICFLYYIKVHIIPEASRIANQYKHETGIASWWELPNYLWRKYWETIWETIYGR